MENINSVTITGNLTRDPELRHTGGGTPVASLRVACNGRRKSGNEWEDDPNYFDVTVWGKQGENCAEYLEKGRGVAVQGRLDWREWEASDGSGKRQGVQIVAEKVQFLGGKGKGKKDPSKEEEPPPPGEGGGFEPSGEGGGEDDIPF